MNSSPRQARPSRRSISGAVALTTALAAWALPTSEAHAQAWLADRRFAEGPGFRVGDFELHPGIGAEFGYDTNYFRRSDDENPIGALRLRITPHFSISTLGSQRRGDAPPPDVEFRGDIAATYDEFFAVEGSDADKDLIGGQRNVGGLLNLALKFFTGRPVFGSLQAGLARTINPSNLGDTSVSFNRLNPNASAEIGFAPGGGLFDFRFNYGISATVFEQSEFEQLTNLNHRIGTSGRWRFLPRSALFYDTGFNFITYANPQDKTGSHPLRARVGYNGLITDWFGVLVAGGWGASFYESTGSIPPNDFDSVIGQAELRFHLTPPPADDPTGAGLTLSAISLGFNRDFQDSFIGTYYEYNRGYLKFSYFFAGRLLLAVDGGAGAVSFPDIVEPPVAAWTDIKVDAQLLAEYRFTDYFALNSTIRYDHYFSDTVITPAGGGGFDDLQWQNFQAYLGARLFY